MRRQAEGGPGHGGHAGTFQKMGGEVLIRFHHSPVRGAFADQPFTGRIGEECPVGSNAVQAVDGTQGVHHQITPPPERVAAFLENRLRPVSASRGKTIAHKKSRTQLSGPAVAAGALRTNA